MAKSYSVLVEGEAWVDVYADSEPEAEEAAKKVLEHNPFGWDSIHATVMNESEAEE